MFGPNMDSMSDSGGSTTGSMVIPVPFIWRHSGRIVYLTGSFTRWSEVVPLSQVEGCPNVFQVIYNLAPGYHQIPVILCEDVQEEIMQIPGVVQKSNITHYKFLVDGEWRYDEHLPYTNNEYGIVNTVVVPRPTYAMNSQIPSGSNMDVDPKAFREMVRVVEVPPIHMMTGISEEDLLVSRHRISEYLSRHTVYELLPESGKVVALDVNLPVKQAFHILHGQGVSTAPLWDFNKGNFVGVLSALDFILILRELGSHGANLTEEELETHTISAWKEGKSNLNRQADGHSRNLMRNLIYVKPYDILKDLVLKILQNGVATIPVLHSSSEDGSFPQLLHLATLSGVLKCICRYFRHCSSSLPILQLPICSLPVGTWVPKIGESNGRPLAMLRPNASLSQALNLLIQAQVSAIPIVDDNDSLLDIYCRSDITALAKDKVYTHINLGETTIQQALQLGQDSYYPYEMRSQRCQMCLRTDSLHKVMERLANPGVRRIVVVEAGSKRVEGIISLSDIFRFFLGFT